MPLDNDAISPSNEVASYNFLTSTLIGFKKSKKAAAICKRAAIIIIKAKGQLSFR